MTAATRRRVVLVNQYFPPDTSATARIAHDFVGECERLGVAVTVICGYPSYEPRTRPGWRPVRRTRRGAVRTVVIGSTGFSRDHAVGRVVNYVTFMLGAVVLVPFLSAHAAFVVMTDPPMAPLLAWWARRVGRVASADIWVQDLHPDFGVQAGLLRNGVFVRAWRRALRASMRSADEVVVLGRDMAARVAEMGVATATRTVHNGWSGVTSTSPTSGGAARPLRITHLGNVGFAGPWDSVREAAHALGDVAEFVFVGGGVAAEVFDEVQAGNVTRLPRVPHDEVSGIAAAADLLLVGVAAGLEGYVVPSKGYEMMALGRPLLVVGQPDSEMRLLVDEFECGFGADDDASSIVAVVRAAAGGRDELRAMAERALAASEQFSRQNQFGPFVEALSTGQPPA